MGRTPTYPKRGGAEIPVCRNQAAKLAACWAGALCVAGCATANHAAINPFPGSSTGTAFTRIAQPLPSRGDVPVVPPIDAVFKETQTELPPGSRLKVNLAMGDMLVAAGNLAPAQEQYEQALKVDPKSLKASLCLARVYAQLGRPDAAMKVYKDAEKYHRKEPALHNDRGLLLADQKQHVEAIASLRQAVKLAPSNSKYHNNLGMVLAAAGQYDQAWAEFREAVGPGPAHYNLALVLSQRGQTAEARDHAERALSAMPTLKQAETLLAQLTPATTEPTRPDAESERFLDFQNVSHEEPREPQQVEPSTSDENIVVVPELQQTTFEEVTSVDEDQPPAPPTPTADAEEDPAPSSPVEHSETPVVTGAEPQSSPPAATPSVVRTQPVATTRPVVATQPVATTPPSVATQPVATTPPSVATRPVAAPPPVAATRPIVAAPPPATRSADSWAQPWTRPKWLR